MHERQFFVYILSSETRTLYIGMTNNLTRRIAEHKRKEIEGFTKQYDVTRLVYREAFLYVGNAIAREKQLKGWRRSKKVDLITASNPLWKDLAADWPLEDAL
ncbi:MAG TPA: GIY-YIG nuclease family protein [bacterium]|jgi:putative endonuclease